DAAEAIRLAAVLLEPIMPSSSREILRRVGAPTGSPRAESMGRSPRPESPGLNFDRDGRWRNDGERVLLNEGPLWPRKEISAVTDKPVPQDSPTPGARPPAASPSSAASPTPAVPAAPALVPSAPKASPDPTAAGATPSAAPTPAGGDRISIEDFMKVELRVAK